LFSLLENSFQEKFCQSWWEKTKQLYVLSALENCYTSSFDMWTSKGVYDLFALVIKILGIN
jgi:hypothetical protein